MISAALVRAGDGLRPSNNAHVLVRFEHRVRYTERIGEHTFTSIKTKRTRFPVVIRFLQQEDFAGAAPAAANTLDSPSEVHDNTHTIAAAVRVCSLLPPNVDDTEEEDEVYMHPGDGADNFLILTFFKNYFYK
jgi:hypothetical protein